MDLVAKTKHGTHEITLEPVDESGGPGRAAFRIRIDGTDHAVDIVPVDAAGGFSLLLDGHPHDFRLVPGGGALRVGDRVIPIEVDDARRFRMRMSAARGHGAGAETVKSPMPGKVVSIPVAVGDAVRAGQTVAVVEAMKMQNELASETTGRVKEIKVAPGQVVDSGEALVVIAGDAG